MYYFIVSGVVIPAQIKVVKSLNQTESMDDCARCKYLVENIKDVAWEVVIRIDKALLRAKSNEKNTIVPG